MCHSCRLSQSSFVLVFVGSFRFIAALFSRVFATPSLSIGSCIPSFLPSFIRSFRSFVGPSPPTTTHAIWQTFVVCGCCVLGEGVEGFFLLSLCPAVWQLLNAVLCMCQCVRVCVCVCVCACVAVNRMDMMDTTTNQCTRVSFVFCNAFNTLPMSLCPNTFPTSTLKLPSHHRMAGG